MKLRVIVAQLLIVLALGAGIYLYVNQMLEQNQKVEQTGHLMKEARLASQLASAFLKDLRRDSPLLADSVSGSTGARVTIIASNGEVMGDSALPAVSLPSLDNHLGRPEVQQALSKGAGASVRYSETVRREMLYVALPFALADGNTAVLRLALPLSSLTAEKEQFQTVLGMSLFVAALLVVFFSYILTRVSTRSLHAIAAIASRISKGEPGTRVLVESGSEVAELARVLNEMAQKTEEQLARISAERNRLDTILRGMGEGIMAADREGVITLVNPSFRDLFALQDEVEGKQIIDISRHPALQESFRIVLASGQERFEELQMHPSGRESTVLTHWVPLCENGVVKGVIAVFHDISDIRRMEKIRKDFVANVSHELRTPVTIIKGYAETLLAGALENSEQSARFVTIINTHAERLASLISDLLTLSQLESGKVGLQSRPVLLHEIAEHAVALLEPKIQERRIMIDCSQLLEAPAVLADPARLEQILVNLLDNAVKYTPAGGAVTMHAEPAGDEVRVAVKDTGIGIPPHDLPRIFERFYRVDTARSREAGGTGLGLSIVKHLVQLLGGTVAVVSSSHGSTFYVTLKRYDVPQVKMENQR